MTGAVPKQVVSNYLCLCLGCMLNVEPIDNLWTSVKITLLRESHIIFILAISVFDSCQQLTVDCCQVRAGAATDSGRGNNL